MKREIELLMNEASEPQRAAADHLAQGRHHHWLWWSTDCRHWRSAQAFDWGTYRKEVVTDGSQRRWQADDRGDAWGITESR